MAVSAENWIILILVGGLFGVVGQGLRTIVGLKKLYDKALKEQTDFSDIFNPMTLMFSLLIGFIAGVLGIVGLPSIDAASIKTDQVLTLIGIGYAGSDFIEGFVKKHTAQFSGDFSGDISSTTAMDADSDNQEQPPVG